MPPPTPTARYTENKDAPAYSNFTARRKRNRVYFLFLMKNATTNKQELVFTRTRQKVIMSFVSL